MIDCKPENCGARSSLCDVIFLVTGDACYGKPLGIAEGRLAFTVDYIVYRSLVVSVENADIEDVLAEESLFAHLGDNVFAVLVDDNNLRKIGAVADIFGIVLFLQVYADKALSLVGIELGVVVYDFGNCNGLEAGKLGTAWIILAVFLLQILEVVDSELCKVVEVVLNLVHLVLDSAELFFHRLHIKLGNLPHRFLHKLVYVLHHNLPLEQILILEHGCKDLVELVLP